MTSNLRLQRVGAAILVTMAALIGLAVLVDAGHLTRGYEVVVEFDDAAGISSGDPVRVAGQPAGEVSSVRISDDHDYVEVVTVLQQDVDLPADVLARITLDTILGTRSVRFELPEGPNWDVALRDVGRVPRTDEAGKARTRTPVELAEVQDLGTGFVEDIDAEALANLVDVLGTASDGAGDDVEAITTGLNRLLGTIADRDMEVRSLLASSGRLADVLARRDEELLDALDDLAQVAETLERRREHVVGLLREATAAGETLAEFAQDNRDELDEVLDDLAVALRIVDEHQVDVAHILASAASGIEGFASIAYAGNVPVPYGGSAAAGAGPLQDYGLGGCGPVDRSLDLLLGEDPVPCAERDSTFFANVDNGE